MKPFESFLAAQLDGFLRYRQDLGMTTRSLRGYLLILDHWLKKQNIPPGAIEPCFFLNLGGDLNVEPGTVNKIIDAARALFNYLVRMGACETNPLRNMPYVKPYRFVPFVFSVPQTDALLKAACAQIRRHPRCFVHDVAVYTALVLLARCGLRIGEPLRLYREQFRQPENTLYIEKTKFKKDRLIPVPQAVARQLKNYLALRKTLITNDDNPYLLVGARPNHRLTDYRLRCAFHQAVTAAGLDTTRQIIAKTIFSAPVPHSLRHSFAVNTLMRISQAGKSAQNALAVLAVYMGHSDWRFTAKYLTVLDATQRNRLLAFAAAHQWKP